MRHCFLCYVLKACFNLERPNFFANRLSNFAKNLAAGIILFLVVILFAKHLAESQYSRISSDFDNPSFKRVDCHDQRQDKLFIINWINVWCGMKNRILFVFLSITVCTFCISFQFHSWRFNWVFEEYDKNSEENENKTSKNSKMIDFSRKISSM